MDQLILGKIGRLGFIFGNDPKDRIGKCPASAQVSRGLMSVHPGTPDASLLEARLSNGRGCCMALTETKLGLPTLLSGTARSGSVHLFEVTDLFCGTGKLGYACSSYSQSQQIWDRVYWEGAVNIGVLDAWHPPLPGKGSCGFL
jgi:hypothetical protein